MEISEDELTEIKEQSYIQGQRVLLLSQLQQILRELGITDDVTKEQLIIEREKTVAMLRRVCGCFGDNDWPDNLYLPDIIDKHLATHLNP